METLTIIFAICCMITVQAGFLKWLFTPVKKNEVPEMRNPPEPPKKTKETILIDIEVNVDKAIIQAQKLQMECLKAEIEYLKNQNDMLIKKYSESEK